MSFERELNKLIFGDFEDLIGEKGLAYLENLDLAGNLTNTYTPLGHSDMIKDGSAIEPVAK